MITLGVVVNVADKPSRDLLGGVEQCAWSRLGIRPKFFLGSPGTKPEHVEEFVATGMDAIIFSGLRQSTVFDFVKTHKDEPPVVMFSNSPLDEKARQKLGKGGAVILDNKQIGERAAGFFVSRGLKNFAFLGRSCIADDISGKIRGKAFEARLRADLGAQMTFDKFTIGKCCSNGDYWEADDIDHVTRWLKRLNKPCGVFVNGDHLAFKLAEICRRQKVSVPESIEILGLNNNDGFCERAMPSVSFIYPDIEACAKEAVNMAVAIAKSEYDLPEVARFVQVPSNMISERGTTALGRGYGRIAVRACEFIRQNACKGIMVADVAKHVGVSRRTLEVRLREATGASVLSLIRDVRMEEVCRLLTTTDMSISEVTLRSGYQLTTNLGVIFKKRFGMTMRAFRLAHKLRQNELTAAAEAAGNRAE